MTLAHMLIAALIFGMNAPSLWLSKAETDVIITYIELRASVFSPRLMND